MDMGNLNSSFKQLFMNHGEWVIAKNEKGRLNVATCDENETNAFEKQRDWIVVSVEETRTDSFKPPENQLYKCARFFIRDLFNSDKKEGYFICRNLPYSHILICGMVVSVSERKDNYCITVDDSTSKIPCLIQKDELNFIRSKYNLEDNQLKESFMIERDNIFLRAAGITQTARKQLEMSIPTVDELKLGDIVKIIGRLSELNNNRYIFINKIRRESERTNCHSVYLEEMFDLYTYYYTN